MLRRVPSRTLFSLFRARSCAIREHEKSVPLLLETQRSRGKGITLRDAGAVLLHDGTRTQEKKATLVRSDDDARVGRHITTLPI